MSLLQDRITSMVHAFGDHERKDAVRALARDVGALEARLAALEAENKALRDRFSDANTERNVAKAALKAAFARVAELEARCNRLEKAGDNLDSSIACGCGVDGPCRTCMRALEFWKQAKEAKP